MKEWKHAFFAAIIGFWPHSALAAPKVSFGCFTRTYDQSHLSKHPAQHVRRLWLLVKSHRDGNGEAEFGMNIWLRGKPQIWRAGGTCSPAVAGWRCSPDTDGASALVITRSGKLVRVANPGLLKIVDDVTGPDLNDALIGAPGDTSFQLKSVPTRLCKDTRS